MARKNNRSRISLLNFAEQFFPARPGRLWTRARSLADTPLAANITGRPVASNSAYVRWLKRESMLDTANKLATKYSGHPHMWRNPYARPQPRKTAKLAGVWYTAYPISHITESDQSLLAKLGDDALWQQFEKIGINALHTGPMKLAGGIDGWQGSPSIDGHFDRISTKIDPAFGTEAEFRQLSKIAERHGGIIIDDIVPGHTGKGADFRLAEMAYRDYPGIYHMIEIYPEDWHLLPEVPSGANSVNLNTEAEAKLKKAHYIVGKLPRVIFYEPGVKETNWSVTGEVLGVDGVKRRWVYLHYFKTGQPTINWLDPSFAGMKLVIGDALHSLGELGSTGLRLDANGFLGIEKGGEDEVAWSEGHPLSEASNLIIAGTVRKLGGFTFQELNLAFDDIKTMSQSGADLSYDFINRPAYHHALATSDTEFLRLTLRIALELSIDPASLVHALQNHDDLTYELVHFWTTHKDDIYYFRGKKVTGSKLRDVIRGDLQKQLTGPKAPYNLLFTENGIACTTASVITAVLGISDLRKLSKDQVQQIIQVHLLLVKFNAWQPGVFALSGWDLAGSLPLEPAKVSSLIADGDTRWINRGAYDLLGANKSAKQSSSGMPKSQNLYPSLPDQLDDPYSFACRLKKVLAIRSDHAIDTAHQIDVPEVSHKSLLVMVHRLESNDLQLTVLNFGPETFESTINSEYLPPGSIVIDGETSQGVATVDNLHNFPLSLMPYSGRFLIIIDGQNKRTNR